jgi:hypothetical protein
MQKEKKTAVKKTDVKADVKSSETVKTFRKSINDTSAFNHVDKAYKKLVISHFEKGDELSQKILAKWYDGSKVNEFGMDGAYNKDVACHYHAGQEKIFIDFTKDLQGSRFFSPASTLFHEIGHMIDHSAGNKLVPNRTKIINGVVHEYYETGKNFSTHSNYASDFLDSIGEDLNKLLRATNKEARKNLEEKNSPAVYFAKEYPDSDIHKESLRQELDFEMQDIFSERFSTHKSNAISDALSGHTLNLFGGICGHSTDYWLQGKDRLLPMEVFANFFQGMFYPEADEENKKYMPSSYNVFRKMVEELV